MHSFAVETYSKLYQIIMDKDNDKSSDFYLNQITELIELKKKENTALKSMVEILIKNNDIKNNQVKDSNKK